MFLKWRKPLKEKLWKLKKQQLWNMFEIISFVHSVSFVIDICMECCSEKGAEKNRTLTIILQRVIQIPWRAWKNIQWNVLPNANKNHIIYIDYALNATLWAIIKCKLFINSFIQDFINMSNNFLLYQLVFFHVFSRRHT